MKHLWIQYGYDDRENAPVLNTADDEREARAVTDDPDAPWYRFDIAKGDRLINADGPHYFGP